MKLLAMIGVIGIIASYNGLIIGCIRQLQCPDTTVVQNFDREQVTFLGCRKLHQKSATGFVQVIFAGLSLGHRNPLLQKFLQRETFLAEEDSPSINSHTFYISILPIFQFLGKWYRAAGPNSMNIFGLEIPLWTVIRPDCARFNFTLNGDGTFGLYIRRAAISLFPV